MINEPEFELIKTCPFLDRTCIGHDCPSFTYETYTIPTYAHRVVLLPKRRLNPFSRKTREQGWGIYIGSVWRHHPLCRTLISGEKRGRMGVSVGLPTETSSKHDPFWKRMNGWDSTMDRVMELPEISQFIEKGDKDE